MHKTGLVDLLTGSGRPRTSRSCVVQPGAVADWWYGWPIASTLASSCLSQRWTFWTCVVTVNLFPLYLMNIIFHTMLDAAGIVLWVHYKSMKCDFLFSQGSMRTLFRRGVHFFIHEQKISSSLQQCKNYKNRSRFPKVMITNVLPPFFMVHSVVVSLLKVKIQVLILSILALVYDLIQLCLLERSSPVLRLQHLMWKSGRCWSLTSCTHLCCTLLMHALQSHC